MNPKISRSSFPAGRSLLGDPNTYKIEKTKIEILIILLRKQTWNSKGTSQRDGWRGERRSGWLQKIREEIRTRSKTILIFCFSSSFFSSTRTARKVGRLFLLFLSSSSPLSPSLFSFCLFRTLAKLVLFPAIQHEKEKNEGKTTKKKYKHTKGSKKKGKKETKIGKIRRSCQKKKKKKRKEKRKISGRLFPFCVSKFLFPFPFFPWIESPSSDPFLCLQFTIYTHTYPSRASFSFPSSFLSFFDLHFPSLFPVGAQLPPLSRRRASPFSHAW